jgi:hypothetical protein
MLAQTSLSLGILLFINHLLALIAPVPCKNFLQHFFRSRLWGIVLLTISGIWVFVLVATIDLGEFSHMRHIMLLAIIVGASLFGWLVPSFLAVRALGFILLLAARPILEITFLQLGFSPFLLSVLAYLWILGGLMLVGIPYLLRDIITIITSPKHQRLWALISYLGLIYGLFLFLGGILSLS